MITMRMRKPEIQGGASGAPIVILARVSDGCTWGEPRLHPYIEYLEWLDFWIYSRHRSPCYRYSVFLLQSRCLAKGLGAAGLRAYHEGRVTERVDNPAGICEFHDEIAFFYD